MTTQNLETGRYIGKTFLSVLAWLMNKN